MSEGNRRRKISFEILGTKISFKMPKVKFFKKTSSKEPEWYWQSVEVPNYYRNISQKVSAVKMDKHKFLNIEQVATINAWLQHLPDPEAVELLGDEELVDMSISSTGSTGRHTDHAKKFRQRAQSFNVMPKHCSTMKFKTFI
eukprot:GFUD01122765.1.p1 GENE.GFUD01122765.1~~GFUD01122765.1.p1  ORF type:complete len:142 (-),score=26.70 GFUD01122765.1:191-616(-)